MHQNHHHGGGSHDSASVHTGMHINIGGQSNQPFIGGVTHNNHHGHHGGFHRRRSSSSSSGHGMNHVHHHHHYRQQGPMTPQMAQVHLDRLRTCIKVTGAIALAISATSFGVTLSMMIRYASSALCAFPLFYMIVTIFNMVVLSKPVDKLKELVIKLSGIMICMFVLCIMAFIGNFIAMIMVIVTMSSGGLGIAGLVPLTFFTIVSMIVHECMAFSFLVATKRLAQLPQMPNAGFPGGMPPPMQPGMYQPPPNIPAQAPQGYNYLAPPPMPSVQPMNPGYHGYQPQMPQNPQYMQPYQMPMQNYQGYQAAPPHEHIAQGIPINTARGMPTQGTNEGTPDLYNFQKPQPQVFEPKSQFM